MNVALTMDDRFRSMNQAEKYQKEAEDAQRMAERALSEADRRAWLRVAQAWFSLIKGPTQTVERKRRDDQD
jgi:hypothetical protein